MTDPSSLLSWLAACGEPVPLHRPWPRYRLRPADWSALIEILPVRDWSLIALWAAPREVHLALRDEPEGGIAVASLGCPQGSFPAVSPARPSAQRMERAIFDLFGLRAEGSEDARPWLDHGHWPEATPQAYDFLQAQGEGLHQIPVGPVHAGIIEPGHFRFHANGETVVRLEERLGYVHKGTERLMQGLLPEAAARLAGRISGDSTVAHAWAFAAAVEAAVEVAPPPRALALRAMMAEIERIANHLGDIGAICNDAAFAYMQAQCGMLREDLLRTAQLCFGHRLMMDRVVPGGVAVDLVPPAAEALIERLGDCERRFRGLVEIYDRTNSLLDRTVGTGVTAVQLVHRFAAGGFVGRAASRGLDARRNPGYAPYDELSFEVPMRVEGDVNARIWIRIREVGASLGLLRQLTLALPQGALSLPLPRRAGEGLALIEGFRGEILTWVRLDAEGHVARCHPRDPSWLQWPLLEAAIEGNIVADFPLCNKSFNCSYSGHDL